MNIPMKSRRLQAVISILILFFSAWAQADANSDFLLSLQYFRSGDYQKSCEVLAPLQKPELVKTHYALNYGHCLFMQKKYSEALEAYRQPVLIKGSFSPASYFYQAKTLRAMGRLDDAIKANEIVISTSSTKNLRELAELQKEKWLSEKQEESAAVALYRKEKWTDARKILDARGFDNLSVEGRFLFVLTDLKLQHSEDAEARLKEMNAMSWLSETEMQSLKLLDDDPVQEETAPKSWVYLDLSAGDNNNVYQEALSQYAISSGFYRISAGAGRDFGRVKGMTPKLSYHVAYDEPVEDRSLRTLSNQVQFQMELSEEKSQLIAGAQVSHQIWDSTSVSRSAGAFLRSSWSGKNFDGGFDVEGSEQVALDPATEYLSGQLYAARAFAGTWGENVYGQIFWTGGVEGTGDVVYSDGSRLPLAQNYSGPGIKLTWRFFERYLLAASVTSVHRDFKNDALPAAKKRIDDETAASMRLLYKIKPEMSVYAQYESFDNSSTLGAADVSNKNYRSSIVTLGLNWDVLP